jgi:hypothetical protein
MCALCGVLGGPEHWTDAVARPGVFTRNTDAAARRRKRNAGDNACARRRRAPAKLWRIPLATGASVKQASL